LSDFTDDLRDITLFRNDIVDIIDITKPEKWLVRTKFTAIKQVCYVPPDFLEPYEDSEQMEISENEYEKQFNRNKKQQILQARAEKTEQIEKFLLQSARKSTPKRLQSSPKLINNNINNDNKSQVTATSTPDASIIYTKSARLNKKNSEELMEESSLIFDIKNIKPIETSSRLQSTSPSHTITNIPIEKPGKFIIFLSKISAENRFDRIR
jgi:hypothetical protein